MQDKYQQHHLFTSLAETFPEAQPQSYFINNLVNVFNHKKQETALFPVTCTLIKHTSWFITTQ